MTVYKLQEWEYDSYSFNGIKPFLEHYFIRKRDEEIRELRLKLGLGELDTTPCLL